MKNTNMDRFLMDNTMIEAIEDDQKQVNGIKISNDEPTKQNMTFDGFTTTKDLDLQLESILKSIEPEVLDAIKKVSKK